MLRKASILIISIAISISSYSQYHLLESQFCKKTDGRGYDGNYESYSVSIYKDSTIKIEFYFIRGGYAPDPTLYKTTYTGSFLKRNDTSTVFYLSMHKERIEQSGTSVSVKIRTIFYSDIPFIFFIRNGVISFPGLQFPDMPACTYVPGKK